MNSLFTTISPEGDLYEVSVQGTRIVRISRYVNGSAVRQDLEFDELSETVKKQIVKQAIEIVVANM